MAGGDDYGTQADVWSLGIVLYELFHGEMLSCHKDKRVSWLETLATASARLMPPRAQAAHKQPGAQPEQLGSLPWAPQPG